MPGQADVRYLPMYVVPGSTPSQSALICLTSLFWGFVRAFLTETTPDLLIDFFGDLTWNEPGRSHSVVSPRAPDEGRCPGPIIGFILVLLGWLPELPPGVFVRSRMRFPWLLLSLGKKWKWLGPSGETSALCWKH